MTVRITLINIIIVVRKAEPDRPINLPKNPAQTAPNNGNIIDKINIRYCIIYAIAIICFN